MQVLGKKAPMAETGPWPLSAGVFGSFRPLVDAHQTTGEVGGGGAVTASLALQENIFFISLVDLITV